MYKPSSSLKSLKHQEQSSIESFSVLCWNVAKLTLKNSYNEYLKKIIKEESLDVLLLQEVKKEISKEIDIYDYSYVFSPNIQTKRHVYGVFTAFKFSCKDELSLLSQKRELNYATHKITLITRHNISENKEFLMVNLHAINFVKSSSFEKELLNIRSAISSHNGPMIVAGDFNTWSVKRVRVLKEFIDDLSLKEVTFNDSSKVKRVFSNCIDYIFYRGLKLTSSKVIDTKLSDHNPIIATFKV